MKKSRIAIIGYGRFGKFLHQKLSNLLSEYEFIVVTRSKNNFKELESADIIIPCVPISALEQNYKNMSELGLKNDVLIIDVASVKVHPKALMQKYLSNYQCIITHPMFGPDSANKSFENLPMMLENINASFKNYENLISFCKKLELNVIEITAEEHDRHMAYSQAYTHLIGRIGERMNLKSTPIDTKGFNQALKIQKYVINDDLQLFIDMFKFNPYTKDMLLDFEHAYKDLTELIK